MYNYEGSQSIVKLLNELKENNPEMPFSSSWRNMAFYDYYRDVGSIYSLDSLLEFMDSNPKHMLCDEDLFVKLEENQIIRDKGDGYFDCLALFHIKYGTWNESGKFEEFNERRK